MNKKFIVLDIETTGLYFEYWDEPIEVCAILIEDKKVKNIFHEYIKPYKLIPKDIEEKTKITNEMVKDKPNKFYILPKLREFIGDNIVVAHNAKFDVDFLNFWFMKLRLPVIKKHICTMKAFKKITERKKNLSLTHACEYFDVELLQAHSAIEDTKATAQVFIKEMDYNVFELEENTDEDVFIRIKKRLYKSTPYKKVREELCTDGLVLGRRRKIEKLEDEMSIIDMFKSSRRIEEISSLLNIEELYVREFFLSWVNNININNYKYLMGSDQTIKEIIEIYNYCDNNFDKMIEMHYKLFDKEPNLFRYKLIHKLKLSEEDKEYSLNDFRLFFESGKTLEFIEEEVSVSKFKVIDFFVDWLLEDDSNRELYRDYIKENLLTMKQLRLLIDMGYKKFREENNSIPSFKISLTYRLYNKNFFKL